MMLESRLKVESCVVIYSLYILRFQTRLNPQILYIGGFAPSERDNALQCSDHESKQEGNEFVPPLTRPEV